MSLPPPRSAIRRYPFESRYSTAAFAAARVANADPHVERRDAGIHHLHDRAAEFGDQWLIDRKFRNAFEDDASRILRNEKIDQLGFLGSVKANVRKLCGDVARGEPVFDSPRCMEKPAHLQDRCQNGDRATMTARQRARREIRNIADFFHDLENLLAQLVADLLRFSERP